MHFNVCTVIFSAAIASFFFLLASYSPPSFADSLQLKQEASLGTGFLISADGHVITAWHVIRNKQRVYVGPIIGNKWKRARVIKLDEKNDLALLQVSNLSRTPLELAEWADVPIGLEAYSIGYPIPKLLGLSRKMTQGLVNGDRTESGDEGFFQFSAETQKGNSGGPVFSPDGLVIGVVQKKLNALKIAERSKDLPENVNYAIKSASVIKFLEGTGVPVNVRKINLSTNLRPYELYRQKHEAVLAVIAKNDQESKLDLTAPEVVD